MLRFAQHDRRPFEQLTRRVVAAHKTVNYASGDDHARRNLRYQGVAQETPALRGRSHIRWRTSIQSKQRDKYETNEINENIGNRRALRGSGEYGAGTDYNDDNYDRSCDRYDHNAAGNDQRGRHDHDLHARLGQSDAPNGTGRAPTAGVLHRGHRAT